MRLPHLTEAESQCFRYDRLGTASAILFVLK
jgi:hypothetical protein